MKIDTSGRAAFRQRMVDVRPIIQSRQVADQAGAADRSPADVFNQAIVDLGFGSDHHRTPGKFAVVETQKKTRPAIDVLRAINPQRKRPPHKSSKTDENGSLVSEFSPSAETPG